MIKELFLKIKKILTDNYKFFVLLCFLFIIINIKLPFYIDKTGGLINVNSRIESDIEYDFNGSINMAYVSTLRATPITSLIALLNPNWDILKMTDENGNSSEKETEIRNKLLLDESLNNSMIVAYKEANSYIDIKKQTLNVAYIYEEANTDLKIGDIIKQIDDQFFNSKEDLINYINSKKVGDIVKIKVINDNKEITRKAEIKKIQNKKAIGIMLTSNYELKTDPYIKLNFRKDESGSSGGLMLSLAIYSLLSEKDIAKGRIVAGTGTIDVFGNVGEISGVKYKLRGAVLNKADIFLVPSGDNYKEAISEKEKNHYDIDIYEVKTFKEALGYLKKETD